MKKFLKTLWNAVWPILAYHALSMVVSVIVIVFAAGTQILAGSFSLDAVLDVVMDSSLIQTMMISVLIVPLMWIAIRKERTSVEYETEGERLVPVKRFRQFERPKAVTYVIMAVCAAFAAVAANFFVSIAELFFEDPVFDRVATVLADAPIWLEILAAVIIGPVAEEALFRGKIYESIDRAYGHAAAVAATSVLFGIFHGNITQFIYAVMMGALFAYARYKTGSLTLTMIMHMAANLGAILLDVFGGMIPFPDIIYRDLIVSCLSTVVSLGAVVMCMMYLNHTYPKREETPYTA